jgi:hypothetical protein
VYPIHSDNPIDALHIVLHRQNHPKHGRKHKSHKHAVEPVLEAASTLQENFHNEIMLDFCKNHMPLLLSTDGQTVGKVFDTSTL